MELEGETNESIPNLSLKRLSSFGEDTKAVLQDCVAKIMEKVTVSLKSIQFQAVHLYVIRHLLPDLLAIGIAQNNTLQHTSGGSTTSNPIQSNSYRLLACVASIIRHMSANDYSMDFAAAIAQSQHSLLLYLFSTSDSVVREQIPEYCKVRRQSNITRQQTTDFTGFHSSNSSTSLDMLSPANSSCSDRSSGRNRRLNSIAAQLNDARVDYLVSRHLDMVRYLSKHPARWHCLEELLDTVPTMCDALVRQAALSRSLSSRSNSNASQQSATDGRHTLLPTMDSAMCPTRNTLVRLLIEPTFNLIFNGHHLPIRRAAARNIIYLMHLTHLKADRAIVLQRLIRELARNPSYRNRMLFLYACKILIDGYFSREFFKQKLLFDECLSMSEDKVPNVRLALCRLLPSLKALLRLPKDRMKLQQLESIARIFYSHDSDRDVTKEAEGVIRLLDQTNIAVESLSRAVPEEIERDARDQAMHSNEEAVAHLASEIMPANFSILADGSSVVGRSSSANLTSNRPSSSPSTGGNLFSRHGYDGRADFDGNGHISSCASGASNASVDTQSSSTSRNNRWKPPASRASAAATLGSKTTTRKSALAAPQRKHSTPIGGTTSTGASTSSSTQTPRGTAQRRATMPPSVVTQPTSGPSTSVQASTSSTSTNRQRNNNSTKPVDPFGHWSSSSDEDEAPRRTNKKPTGGKTKRPNNNQRKPSYR